MRKTIAIIVIGLACLFAISTANQKQNLPAGTSDAVQPVKQASVKMQADFGRMPLYFIQNRGQADSQVAYYLQGKDKTIYFTSEGLTYVLSERRAEEQTAETTASVKERSLADPAERKLQSRSDQRRFGVKLDFVGANADVRPSGEEKTEAVISYFKGKPEEWKAGLPTYSRIVYKNLWPGIDLAYYGTVDKMKYEFVVHPGADPSLIRLAYRGASAVEVNGEGRLEVKTPAGGFTDDRPVGYQEIVGKKNDVAMSYLLEETPANKPGPNGKEAATKSYIYGFEVGDYDPTKPLVLDPAVFVYCGYIHGTGLCHGYGITVDSSGNAYVTGQCAGLDRATVGPDLTNNGYLDAFVAKVNASGTALIYAGYIGGVSEDKGQDIAVDSAGCAYVTGNTKSTETTFPVLVGPDLTYNGDTDAFVAKVNAAGTALVYCGYIGGSGYYGDSGNGIAVDGSGNAYVTGTTSGGLPVIVGPDLTHNGDMSGGSSDGFVAKINASGTGLVYCGYIGGASRDGCNGITVDNAGCAYIAGGTWSAPTVLGNEVDKGFPVVGGPDLTYNGGWNDGFVAKVNAAGTALVYCGYIGGSGNYDGGQGIAVDGSGNAYVIGNTDSTEATFPVVGGPDLTYNGNYDAFVAKVNASGSALTYCGYIGGPNTEYGYGIAVDGSGNAYVTGDAGWHLPVIVGPDLRNDSGGIFVAKITNYSAKDDFLGVWNLQGIYYKNFDTNQWVLLETSIASQVALGDLDGDGIDDLIGLFPSDPGVWVKKSRTASWLKLDSITPNWVSAGDMNGDGQIEFLGSWNNDGVYYKNLTTNLWVKLETSTASQIATGDLDGDGKDDLIGIWPGDPGVWVKKSSTASWLKADSLTPVSIAAGDMNGNGRVDLLGSWTGQGVFYKDFVTNQWFQMESSTASQVTAGDVDGDGTKDLIGVWAGDPGAWAKKSSTGGWWKLDSLSPLSIAAGKMRTAASAPVVGLSFRTPFGSLVPGEFIMKGRYEDESLTGPHGKNFRPIIEKNARVGSTMDNERIIPGPGEPGFKPIKDENSSGKKGKK